MIKPENKREPVTESEYTVLDNLVEYVNMYGYQPSMNELARMCDLASVFKQLKSLEKKGYLKLTGLSRSIDIAGDLLR